MSSATKEIVNVHGQDDKLNNNNNDNNNNNNKETNNNINNDNNNLIKSNQQQLPQQQTTHESVQISSRFCINHLNSLRSKFCKYKAGKIVLEKDDSNGIAVITIDNQGRKNALSGSMMIELMDVVDELERWDKGKGLILRGNGGFFSSGGDMNTVKSIDNHEDGRDMGILMYNSLQRLQNLPMISVALIEGKAIGGGAELTTACDFRLMSESAMLGFVHIKLGITVSWGGGTRLVHILGPNKALEILTSGRQLTAKEALDIGLSNGTINEPANSEAASVLSVAKEWLSEHISGPHETIAIVKQIIYAASNLPYQESLENELNLFPRLWGSPPHKKALSMNIKHRMKN